MLGTRKQLEIRHLASANGSLIGPPLVTRTLSSMGIVVNALWLSVIVAAGLSAAMTFKNVPPLEPVIADYESLDQATRSRIVAGLITGPTFEVADLVQWVLAPLLIIILIIQRASNPRLHRNLISWISTCSILAASLIFMARSLWLNPIMNSDLERYRAAARAGDSELVRTTYEIFDRWHVLAENLWGLVGLLLLISLACLGAMVPSRSSLR